MHFHRWSLALLAGLLLCIGASAQKQAKPAQKPPLGGPAINKSSVQPPDPDRAYVLKRAFEKGKVDHHTVKLVIDVERQVPTVETLLPHRETLTRTTRIEPLAVSPLGIADCRVTQDLHYHISESLGSSARTISRKGKPQTLVFSPLNILIAVESDKKKRTSITPLRGITPSFGRAGRSIALQASVEQSMTQLVVFSRLLDFGPQFPEEPVKVGETWEQEIGFVPGKVTADSAASEDKASYVRVVCKYKLDSVTKKNGRDVAFVTATFDSDMDALPMMKGRTGEDLKAFNAKVNGRLTYQIDLKSGMMLGIEGKSSGKMTRTVLIPDRAAEGGKYEMNLNMNMDAAVSGWQVPPKPTKPAKPKRK